MGAASKKKQLLMSLVSDLSFGTERDLCIKGEAETGLPLVTQSVSSHQRSSVLKSMLSAVCAKSPS